MLAFGTFDIPMVETVEKTFRPAAAAPASMNQKIIDQTYITVELARASVLPAIE